jgi:hypothetical protein
MSREKTAAPTQGVAPAPTREGSHKTPANGHLCIPLPPRGNSALHETPANPTNHSCVPPLSRGNRAATRQHRTAHGQIRPKFGQGVCLPNSLALQAAKEFSPPTKPTPHMHRPNGLAPVRAVTLPRPHLTRANDASPLCCSSMPARLGGAANSGACQAPYACALRVGATA